MRTTEPALILHVRPYRETSAIVQCLTPSQGRLAGVMRGARPKSTKQTRGVKVQPFYFGEVTYFGNTNLATVSGFESIHFFQLQGVTLYSGFYLLELLTRLVPEREAEEGLFRDTLAALQQLEAGAEVEICLRRFELQLLEHLGYGVNFEFDAQSGELIDPGAHYGFVPALGFLENSVSAGSAGPPVTTYAGATILAIAARDFADPTVRKAAKLLLRESLAEGLGPKPLTSRALFKDTT
ncbi:MAG TPA: DNA repair protein RecO [Gammaproteobacteria bacterium]|nr:DNA repair protein RecO [Gammaproteobacteria bacterium]